MLREDFQTMMVFEDAWVELETPKSSHSCTVVSLDDKTASFDHLQSFKPASQNQTLLPVTLAAIFFHCTTSHRVISTLSCNQG